MNSHGLHAHESEDTRTVKGFQRGLLVALAITAAIMVAELIGGLLSNSLALLSDAAHMLTDVLALLLSILAFRFSTRPPTKKTTFGLYRLEIFAAQINGAFLLFLSLFIFYEAYKRFLEPESIRSVLMMIVAGVGLLANMASALVLHKSSQKNLNVRASFLHVMGDLLSSVAVIIGGVIIHFTGWLIVDPILSGLIGVIILRGAYTVVKETANILLEAVPEHINLERLIQEIEALDGVESFHDVHLWTITSGIHALSAHVLIKDQMVSESVQVLETVRTHLQKEYNIHHTTLQIECRACEAGFVCQLERV